MAIAAMVAVAAATLVTRAGAREDAREIRLVARGMAFYLAGDPSTPNLTVAAGERVRFVLRNEATGFVHDLAVADLGIAVSPLTAGQMGDATAEMPARPGRYEYRCQPHAAMMKGSLVIE
jgi:plastocyanin